MKYNAASISPKSRCFLLPLEHHYPWTSFCVFAMIEQSCISESHQLKSAENIFCYTSVVPPAFLHH